MPCCTGTCAAHNAASSSLQFICVYDCIKSFICYMLHKFLLLVVFLGVDFVVPALQVPLQHSLTTK